jgi:septal ring factor EnvC (AmiA/AmiB activator)
MNEALRDACKTSGWLERSERDQEMWQPDRATQLENQAADALIERLRSRQREQEQEEAQTQAARKEWEADVERWREARRMPIITRDMGEPPPSDDPLLAFADMLGEEIAKIEQQIRRDFDRKLQKLKDEIAELRKSREPA